MNKKKLLEVLEKNKKVLPIGFFFKIKKELNNSNFSLEDLNKIANKYLNKEEFFFLQNKLKKIDIFIFFENNQNNFLLLNNNNKNNSDKKSSIFIKKTDTKKEINHNITEDSSNITNKPIFSKKIIENKNNDFDTPNLLS